MDDCNTSILCPALDCTLILTHSEVQQHSTDEVFERYTLGTRQFKSRYDRMVFKKVLAADPNYRRCRMPDCSAGKLVDNPGKPRLRYPL